jgi:hypothetical protein
VGALPKPLAPRIKKPVVRESAPPKRDQYGRDPESAAEKLRGQSDYDADTGYAPLYHAALADLPRLSSGAVCYAFVLVVNMLSYGRGKDKSGQRYEWTLPITQQTLADLCRASVRQIQREIEDLSRRGMIRTKQAKRGQGFEISLLYRDWRGLEDYAVWKRQQIVVMDETPDEETEDESPMPISRNAVRLVKKPLAVRPGRASRAVKVSVGVKEFAFQNDSKSVDLAFDAVIQSGRLVVSATSGKTEESRHDTHVVSVPSDGGSKKNRHDTHVVSPATDGGIENKKYPPEREHQVAALFDPLLQRSGSRLLSPDKKALQTACSELGAMPYEWLEGFVIKQRAKRAISGPRVVAAIVKEARLNWEVVERQIAQFEAADREWNAAEQKRRIADYRRILADSDRGPWWSEADLEFMREQVAEADAGAPKG